MNRMLIMSSCRILMEIHSVWCSGVKYEIKQKREMQ